MTPDQVKVGLDVRAVINMPRVWEGDLGTIEAVEGDTVTVKWQFLGEAIARETTLPFGELDCIQVVVPGERYLTQKEMQTLRVWHEREERKGRKLLGKKYNPNQLLLPLSNEDTC